MWLGRRYRSARAWFGSQSWRSKLLLGAALFTSPCWCGCGGLFVRAQYIHWFVFTAEDREFFRNRTDYQEGAPSVARRLKAEMEPIPAPDAALRHNPEWFAVRCTNGEWAFGHGINSHGLRPGHGTFVVRDSRGRVHIYFGHVCGPNAGIEWLASTKTLTTLDAFYDMLAEYHPYLREWVDNQ